VRQQSLEDVLQTVATPVALLRNSQAGPRVFPVVAPQFSNWLDEQRSWRESCALFDLSHHMTDLFIAGPDAIRLVSELGVNSFENFDINKGKHFVTCNHDGYVIGDVILYHVAPDRVDLVGRPSVHNWVQYNIETGGYDVTTERDEDSTRRQGPPAMFRYQVQGPNALKLMEHVTGGPLPKIRFFNMAEIGIAGLKVRTLRHGMAGQPGYELSGPWEYGEEVKGSIVDAGQEHGLRQVGTVAYQTATAESGWIPCPVPAIYSGDRLKRYREWLPADGYEGAASLGGSLYSEDISEYYLTPYELGYGSYVKFDHDFVGREALAEMSDKPGRKKVTLVWNRDDVTRTFASLFYEGTPPKYINFPSNWYSMIHYDRVVKDGGAVGISTYGGYTVNERAMLSLACIDEEHSEPGTEVTVLWGEEPNSTKPPVERHVQMEIRATVAPVPYAEPVRAAYRS
jgi:vanillate/3-O-methylgallate O-demethylase